MRAGEKRHRITIQKPTKAQSATGEVTDSFSNFATVFASVQPLSGREAVQAEQGIAESTIRIRMRYINNLTVDCQIIYKGRTLEINSVINIDEINKEYELLCSESV
jgi:SPP1 family predicted phage head-tail adaptor|tara:strand:+ start:2199 stop:2516 length:318 start_codon:yes stop_codon:yes gene_type:complete